MAQSFDLIVVGGGPGGYVAAIRAAQLKMKVALVEREHLGGICLNWGCIPTKALLRSAEVLELMRHAASFGLAADNPRFDAAAVVKRSRGVAQQLSRGVGFLLKKNKVTVFDGEARLAGKGKLAVKLTKGGEETLEAKHIILATGARARQLPGLETDGKLVWSYKEAMVPEKMPKSLLVVGSGAIGIEFASFYRSMDAEVTVVEVLPRVLPVEDEEISAFAQKAFEKRGIKIRTNATVKALKKGTDNVTATVESGGKTEEHHGRAGDHGRGHRRQHRGSRPGRHGREGRARPHRHRPLVPHRRARRLRHRRRHRPALARPQGQPRGGACASRRSPGIEGLHPMDVSKIPGCTYCTPQVASVGLTEKAAKDAGYELKVGRFPFIGNGKAIALGEPEGMVKTVFDAKTGELLGAHMVGAEVTELIQGYVIARTMEATEADLMHTIFPHPTLSEMMHEAALDAYGRAIHF